MQCASCMRLEFADTRGVRDLTGDQKQPQARVAVSLDAFAAWTILVRNERECTCKGCRTRQKAGYWLIPAADRAKVALLAADRKPIPAIGCQLPSLSSSRAFLTFLCNQLRRAKKKQMIRQLRAQLRPCHHIGPTRCSSSLMSGRWQTLRVYLDFFSQHFLAKNEPHDDGLKCCRGL